MLHVTDALLSLGTLQVASRSVRTRKSAGSTRPSGPRFKGIWRTGGRGGEQAKGLQKSMEAKVGGYFSFPLDFSLESRAQFVEERRESRSRRGFFEKIRKRGKIEVDCWWKNVKRLSLKSLSREHRENRTTFNNRRNFLLHVAICNDAPLNYNFLPWNRMEESRYSY